MAKLGPLKFLSLKRTGKLVYIWKKWSLVRHRLVPHYWANFFTSTWDVAVYRDVIMQFTALLMPEERWCYLQQDGVTAHTTTETINFLLPFFGDQVMLKGLCSPPTMRSSHLTPPDFILWSHLKNKVFESGVPASLDVLPGKIKEEI